MCARSLIVWARATRRAINFSLPDFYTSRAAFYLTRSVVAARQPLRAIVAAVVVSAGGEREVKSHPAKVSK